MDRKIITFFIFIIINLLIYYYSNLNKENEQLKAKEMEIYGVIDAISFDEKSIATVEVNQKQFYLASYNVRKRHGIKKGDSISKKADGLFLNVYVKDKRKVFHLYKRFKVGDNLSRK